MGTILLCAIIYKKSSGEAINTNMYEFEDFEYEFSKIYKRLLRLELFIKFKIKQCALSAYQDDVMTAFQKFFTNSKIYNKYRNDRNQNNSFLIIRDNKDIIDSIKFTSIINILTLRHLLHFIFTEESFRIQAITNKFYVKTNINFKELKDSRFSLINLRNHIAHFNFKEYSENKNEYLYSLLLYEICIGCSLGRYENIPNNLGLRPSMSTIIEKIYELCPELFTKNIPHTSFPYNKDRIIVDMYEDIAVLNGYEYNELKSQWDIIRHKYIFNKKKAEQEGIQNLETEGQLSIFDEINWNK